ncbi:ferritin-like domain-containing protein [Flavimarina sp. Hel_I_48]|uniref:ferritin-like domain-containing protein n=1 Tax=Flavimarina sp. Hel_I_48 TaxID=1392488 RepID=UPI0004DEFF0A|nr:ferritin-like domain-containing protein [Flavimarina sp. Hel_I_48]
MSILKLLEDFTTEKLTVAPSSRRQMFGSMGSLGKKAAIAAIPFGLAASSSKAKAATVQTYPNSSLQLALVLEYLEAEFYTRALESGVLANYPKAEAVYMQISKHENAHVSLLKGALEDNAFEAPEFDFTAGGNFDPFGKDGTNSAIAYQQLLALAQAFEDTGVRAYKGQATNLMNDPALLTVALQIHSVEARHASEIRRLRGLKGWITGDDRGMGLPPVAQAVYIHEDNTMQGGVDVTTLGDGTPFTFESSTEAYDEPLTSDDAGAIAALFLM